MQSNTGRIQRYNQTVRRAARAHSMEFGIDTDRSRRREAAYIRRVRREFPFSQFGITWGT
jgi:hypothetical protein